MTTEEMTQILMEKDALKNCKGIKDLAEAIDVCNRSVKQREEIIQEQQKRIGQIEQYIGYLRAHSPDVRVPKCEA